MTRVDNILLNTFATSQQRAAFLTLQSNKTTTSRELLTVQAALKEIESNPLPCLTDSKKTMLTQKITDLTTSLNDIQKKETQVLSSVRKKGVGALALFIASLATAALYLSRSNNTAPQYPHKEWLDEHKPAPVNTRTPLTENKSDGSFNGPITHLSQTKNAESTSHALSHNNPSTYRPSFEIFSSSESFQDDSRDYAEFRPQAWPPLRPLILQGANATLALPRTPSEIAQNIQERSTYTSSGNHVFHKRAAFRFSPAEIFEELDSLQTQRDDLVQKLKMANLNNCNEVLSEVIALWSTGARTNYPATPLGGFEWIKFFLDHVVIELSCDKSSAVCTKEYTERARVRTDLIKNSPPNSKEAYHWKKAHQMALHSFVHRESLRSSPFITNFAILKEKFMECYGFVTSENPSIPAINA